jgi:hypothetical protein
VNPTTIVLIVILILAWLTTVAVCVMKGKPWFAFFGILVHGWLFAFVGAIRLAKPNSWWDRHRYSPEQHRQAVERFEYRAPLPQTNEL